VSTAPAADKYKFKVVKSAQPGDSEALLRVHLTACPPAEELPPNLFANGEFQLPTVEVSVEKPGYDVISHPQDLAHFGRAVDDAMKTLQDEWRVRTIHLIVIAPTTACVRIGQKLQARHHADVVLYERKPVPAPARGPFEPTIRISSTEVTLLSTGESTSIT
jgi:hypothetical protein